MKVILPLAILAANLVLFLMNKTLFLENLKPFKPHDIGYRKRLTADTVSLAG